ncbi:MAG: hypothetical protein DWQ36_08630 [Acidobacteria bacterium]|nr:MAG: hypothetical protein DWQ36_08630 [Acidobacteriota bacterium]
MAAAALALAGCDGIEWGRVHQPDGVHARHVVLLVLDTVRADRMSLYGHHRPTTPFLDQLAGSSVVFDRAKSPAPWTVPSHASMFTGLWPSRHEAQWGRFVLDEKHLTLAELLAARGFHTVGLSANTFVSRDTGFAQGFRQFGNPTVAFHDRSEEILRALPTVFDLERRNFVFLNFLDAHIPYNTRRYGAEYGVLRPGGPVRDADVKWQISAGARPFTDEEKDQHGRAYDAAIRYVDDLVAAVVEQLEQLGVLDETLLIVTSDHGDGLGEHQIIGHTASTWEEQLAVPLLLRLPAAFPAARLADLVSTTAVAATAVDALGLPRPAGWDDFPSLYGISAGTAEAPDPPQTPVLADYRSYFSEDARAMNAQVELDHPQLAAQVHHTHVLYCDRTKLAVRPEGMPTLFDLAADPTEQSDLWSAEDPLARRCFSHYRRLLGAGLFTDFDAVVTQEQRDAAAAARNEEELRALGYIN